LQATDSDSAANGCITYRLADGDFNADFTVDNITGELRVVQPLDYELVGPGINITAFAINSATPYLNTTTTVWIILEVL